jgi:hypothetical protein
VTCSDLVLSCFEFKKSYALIAQTVTSPCNLCGDICSGLIEKNTWAGMDEVCSKLQMALLEEGSHLPVTKKKTRRRRRLLSVCPPGLEEPKHRISRPVSSKRD